jgi:HlyD family secretion protein
MPHRRLILIAVIILAIGGYAVARWSPASLVLTGIVTTNDVIVSPQIDGRIVELRVTEGDVVTRGQVLALIDPRELSQDQAYYLSAEQGAGAQVREAEAALRLQEQQTTDQIAQAVSTLASIESQQSEAAAALENARLELDRAKRLADQGITPVQQLDQARTTYEAARAHVDSLKRQGDAQRSAVALARANAQQVAVRRSQLQNSEQQQHAAAAQRVKADVRLEYSEVRAPIDAIVNVRAVRPGETVSRGEPLLTLVNPDDLWVRVDVEESYIDRVRLGDRLRVTLPSGDEREGQVFFRGVDAGFATQRDVSRTKRDIKTFEVRLRVDNRDRRLAVGMTTYVKLPVGR